MHRLAVSFSEHSVGVCPHIARHLSLLNLKSFPLSQDINDYFRNFQAAQTLRCLRSLGVYSALAFVVNACSSYRYDSFIKVDILPFKGRSQL